MIEFTYNNSFHSTIGMAPYEALYGRRCRTPLCWLESREGLTLGPEVVQQTTEKVRLIQERMRIAQSRQKKSTTMQNYNKMGISVELSTDVCA